MLRRIGLWFLAAVVALAVLFVAVLIYQLTVYKPDPPKVANCTPLQTLITEDSAAQLYVYHCKRGNEPSWQGYEVWVEKLAEGDWQRLVTAPQASGCLSIALQPGKLTVYHQGSRGHVSVAAASLVYELPAGAASTLSIATERVSECPVD
ncbi:hypothetical protein [Pseudidiomarina insulisalsae]|uniref:Uncharacterized protein n=1 Tax=Pseudidiomarina insulisalsae TaxID=575789 RepID=A0A432YMG8_9GAMM|nr:hypothetical protein [Pseudidiomarina insulisalsae]RUO62143.1 hypothetical protein CWI71_04640 [Pseudidiomarina insulisalsae]